MRMQDSHREDDSVKRVSVVANYVLMFYYAFYYVSNYSTMLKETKIYTINNKKFIKLKKVTKTNLKMWFI